MSLASTRTLGRSGLVVSPFALGTMTFGTARWGSGEAESRAIFDAYVEAGGNFFDTADVYSGGKSEEMVGSFVADRGLRHQAVISTKSGFATKHGQGPYVGGAGAKNLYAAVDGSLKRLKTDFIDLYWLHTWDGVTPAEEVLETMTTLVRSGKIRYWGLSNAPAWWCAKIVTLAHARGVPGPIALQYFYSLVSRDPEDEHIPLALDSGLGFVPWSPLAYGFLTGKYDRAQVEAAAPRQGGLPRDAVTGAEKRPETDNRLDGANPFGDSLFTEHNWKVMAELRRVAAETGLSPAKVALAWLMHRPGVSAALMGVSRPAQVADNVAALDVVLSPEHRAALDAVSASANPRLVYGLSTPALRKQLVFGGTPVAGWRE